jgi:GNAT superfamily N-acetyltransferase
MKPLTWSRGPLEISTDPGRLDLDVIHGYLSGSYWARGIPRDVVERSIRNSLCFGIHDDRTQVGFGRVVSDFATFAYVGDVFVVESHRGRGLAKWLMACMKGHPDLQGLRRWCLATRDAHGLYRPFGFAPLADPSTHMEILNREVYA